MRILHTSDWHVGRRFCGVEVLDHLGAALDALIATVREDAVDVVVISGDLYDRAAPPTEAVAFLSTTLRRIREAGAQIVTIPGNHDAASRVGYGSWASAAGGLHVFATPEQIGTPVELTDEHGPVHFFGIPFLDPHLDRTAFGPQTPRSHGGVLDAAMGRVRAALRTRPARSVVLAHCFAVPGKRGSELPTAAASAESVTGSMRSLAVGGIEVAPSAVFEGASYVALGHLHSPQLVSDSIRYAGAPLAYSFTDRAGARGCWLVDLDADGLAQVQWRDLPVPRPMSTLTGTIDDLLSDPAYAAVEGHWIRAVLTDQQRPIEAMRRLRRRFAHCVQIEFQPAVVIDGDTRTYRDRVLGKSDLDVALEFVALMRNGVGADAEERELLQAAFEATAREVDAPSRGAP